MLMTDYIRAIKCALRDQHHIKPSGGTDSDPCFAQIPDGDYLCDIEGKIDKVVIFDGKITCCNFA